MMTHYIYGKHAVLSFLEKNANKAKKLFVLKKNHDSKINMITRLVEKNDIPFNFLDRDALNQLVDTNKHQGVVLAVDNNTTVTTDLSVILAQRSDPLLLILDGIQDPHNLGACLRSAQAAGVDAVIVPKDNAVSLTATVRKVACGAAECIPFIAVTNLARTMRDLQQQGVWLYGLDSNTETSLYSMDFKHPMALVLGAEGKGLRSLTKKHCDVLLKIPMPGDMESLNVSVATGISLFEVVRQRFGY